MNRRSFFGSVVAGIVGLVWPVRKKPISPVTTAKVTELTAMLTAMQKCLDSQQDMDRTRYECMKRFARAMEMAVR